MQDISFKLISETYTKDSTGQWIPSGKPTEISCIGLQRSISQNEFYQADQAGIRSEGVLEMNSADYSGETTIEIDGKPYTIYRTYEPKDKPDIIELYYGERVGNGQPIS